MTGKKSTGRRKVNANSSPLETVLFKTEPLPVEPFDIIAAEGSAFQVEGNQPFLLQDPDSVWLVKAGRVEVFAVQLNEQAASVGSRYHVCTIETGQVLFGLATSDDSNGLGLLAVGSIGTQMVKLTIVCLRQLVLEPHLAPTIAGWLETWVAGLTSDLTNDLGIVSSQVLLEPQTETSIEAMQRAAPNKDGVWINFKQGRSLLLGEEPLDLVENSALFPLYGDIWLQALEPCHLEVLALVDVVGEERSWIGLDIFHKLFFKLKSTNIRLASFDEITQLGLKAEYEQKVEQKAVSDLAEVLESSNNETPAAIEPTKDTLLAACHLVGEAQGITIVGPPELEGVIQPRRNHLLEIARSSRVRTRPITLTASWWELESGPMLGFTTNAVALLPIANHAYEMVSPADGSRKRVTAKVADSITPLAYIFYRPLPYKQLKIKDLLQYAAYKNKADLLRVLVLSVFTGILGLLVPIITGQVVDAIIPSTQREILLQIMIALVVAALAVASFQITRGIAVLRMETRSESAIQTGVFDRLLGLETSFFRNYTSGDLGVRVMGISAIRQLISSSVTTTILASVSSIFSFFLLFSYDLGLALLTLLLTVVTLAVTISLSLAQMPYQRQQTELQGAISSLVLQMITGISKLRVAGAELRAFGVWAKQFAHQRRMSFKLRSINNLLLVFNAAWPILTLMVIFLGVDIMSSKQLSIGSFLAFNAAFGSFLAAMLSMTTALTSILQAIPLYERIKPVFEALPEVSSEKLYPGELSGSIEINNVSFRYDEDAPYVLSDVSLQIKPGQLVAIVGSSGSGKSSLLRLLLGFETPNTGSIYYDNQDLASLNVQEVRRQIGVVIQNGRLTAGDIYHYIVGSLPYTQDDAWEAARLAGVEQDIREMPMGMFTSIAEGGSTLSGGQRQRLMIAKAIVTRPRILLFDEATSSLDNRTQAVVNQSLEGLQATRIVIAHRLSTIINADCIYVLEGGKIVQSGTYSNLLEQNGPFKELAARQVA